MSTPLAANPRPQTFADRRASVRHDCNYLGFVKIQGAPLTPCRVVNVSAGGALLELQEPIGLPASFRISIPMELFEADCETRHQTGKHVGVMFTSNLREALARFG